MKKIVSLVLFAAMLMGLTACGGTNNNPSTTADSSTAGSKESAETTESTPADETQASAIDFDEEPYTIHICYAVLGEAQPDLTMIEEKLNEITLREINAKVELEAISLFSMANVYALKASSQEKMDLMILFPGSSYMTSFANSNLIMPIEDYVDQWGSDLTAVLGDMMQAGEYKDHLYAIPQNKDVRKNALGFNLSKELCEKYDIDPAAIQTIEDLEAAFETIKANEPEITVLMPETSGGSIAYVLAGYYDNCGTGSGGLEVQDDGSLKVVNYYDNESYMQACQKVREWYEKGYISKDVLTAQESGSQAMQAGKCFANAVTSISPNMGDQWSTSILLSEEKPYMTTTDDQLILWAVPSTCERPDKSIQFLNMCFASEEATNLMMYGVEDVHYTMLENGSIDTTNNADWQNYWPMFGDYNKQYIRADLLVSMGVETVEQYKTTMAAWEVEMSPAYGFNFDPTNVKTDIAACDAVNDEYMQVIANGTVDPEVEIPKWIQKLKDAGIQNIIDEKQKQLDEWLASQNE